MRTRTERVIGFGSISRLTAAVYTMRPASCNIDFAETAEALGSRRTARSPLAISAMTAPRPIWTFRGGWPIGGVMFILDQPAVKDKTGCNGEEPEFCDRDG